MLSSVLLLAEAKEGVGLSGRREFCTPSATVVGLGNGEGNEGNEGDEAGGMFMGGGGGGGRGGGC